jgi:hypothetical protein
MGLLTRKALTFGLKGILSFLLSLIFQNKEVFYPLEIRVKNRSTYSGHYSFFKSRLKMIPGIVSVRPSFF